MNFPAHSTTFALNPIMSRPSQGHAIFPTLTLGSFAIAKKSFKVRFIMRIGKVQHLLEEVYAEYLSPGKYMLCSPLNAP